MRDFALGLQMLMRALRAGEVTLLAAALALAVAAMATVSLFTDRTRLALEREANRLLGADLVLTSSRPILPALKQEALRRGLSALSTLAFRSMLVHGSDQLLGEITAVEPGYPLRGTTRIAARRAGADEVPAEIPKHAAIWADERLFGQLDLGIGDALGIGNSRFTVSALLTQDPSLTLNVFALGPRLIMRYDDVERTGLLGPGARVIHRLLIAGDPATVDRFRDWAQPLLGVGVRMEGVRDARPELRAALERAERFMGLAALAAVVIASVAVALATRRFYERQIELCAMLRCLGSSQQRVVRFQLVQLLGLGVAASTIGCVFGLIAQMVLGYMLSAAVGVSLPAPSYWSALRTVALGLALLLGFGLPPIVGLRQVSALRALRRDLEPTSLASIAGFVLGMCVVVALIFLHARDLHLAGYLLGGCALTVLVAAVLGRLLLRVLAGLGPGRGVSWRYGIASLRRRSAATLWQVIALALGLTAMLTLTLVRSDLLRTWQASVPPDAPNRFLVNIQPDQTAAVRQALSAALGRNVQLHPMVRGRLVAINGKAVNSAQYGTERARRLVEREFNLTWSNRLPEDNRVTAGSWHGASAGGEPALSVETGIAGALNIKLGDRLTYDVGGETFEAPVTSLRKVAWDTFRANFFVIASEHVLENYPATYIASIYLPSAKAGSLVELVRQFPNIVVIDVQALLAQVQAMIAQVARAVQFVFAFTLAAGLLVLYVGVSSTHDERIREVAIMRTLGARRGQVTSAYAMEFATIGALAGLLAAGGASFLGYFAATELLNLVYSWDPRIWGVGILSGAVGVCGAGLWFTRRVLSTPPLMSLREV